MRMRTEIVKIELDLARVRFEADSITHAVGRAKELAGAAPRLVAEIQGDERLDDVFARAMRQGLGALRDMLTAYLTEGSAAGDNGYDAPGAVVLELVEPVTYDKTATAALAEACHESLVAYAVAGMLKHIAPEEAAEYAALAQAALGRVGVLSHRRTRQRPRHGGPF